MWWVHRLIKVGQGSRQRDLWHPLNVQSLILKVWRFGDRETLWIIKNIQMQNIGGKSQEHLNYSTNILKWKIQHFWPRIDYIFWGTKFPGHLFSWASLLPARYTMQHAWCTHTTHNTMHMTCTMHTQCDAHDMHNVTHTTHRTWCIQHAQCDAHTRTTWCTWCNACDADDVTHMMHMTRTTWHTWCARWQFT